MHAHSHLGAVALAGLALSLLMPVSAKASDARIEFFEKKIRPILVQHCTRCHGPDQKAGLRLDHRVGLLKGGDTGPAIVPGDPNASRLIQAVRYTSDLRMPPKGKLDAAQIANLEHWVRNGAAWPEGDSPVNAATTSTITLEQRAEQLWSFQPIRRNLSPPAVRQTAWPRNLIDCFILAKLEAQHLNPAPDTNRRSWLRRVTFDLTGLPPTRDEIASFLADDSPLARERVVDRLLASPAYGERWGRHWLDLTRFAETRGHEFDFEIFEAWRYRDYVVRALNADVPYDQFVLEHLAGDLLTTPRRHPTSRLNESIVATGSWFLSEGKHSPVDIRQDEADRVDNQIDVFSKAFLGLTVACARCHDHKFDPISTRDYYALAGYLQSSRSQRAFLDHPDVFREPIRAVTQAETQLQQQAVPAMLKAVEAWLDRPDWLTRLRQAKHLSPTLIHLLSLSDSGSYANRKASVRLPQERASAAHRNWHAQATTLVDFADEDFADWFVTGWAWQRPTATLNPILDQNASRPVSGFAAPYVADSGRIALELQGVLRSPTFRLEKDYLWYRVAGKKAKINLIIDGFQLIRNPIYGGLTKGINHGNEFRWVAMDVSMWRGHMAYIECKDEGPGFLALDQVVASNLRNPAPPPPSAWLAGFLADHRITSTGHAANKLRAQLRRLLADARAGRCRSAEDAAILTSLVKACEPLDGLANWHQQFAAWLQIRKALPTPTRALAMADGTPERERVHIRGNHKNLGDPVPRRYLEVFVENAPAPIRGSGRLELARNLVGPDNTLVARVIVNRLWHHHFGAGLVRTPDDFGVQGQPPTHPNLLDYLANRLQMNGWSLKELHRDIVLSRVYGLASTPVKASLAGDPINRLWHYRPVRRLEAEAIRDTILAVSGQLTRQMEGRGPLPHLTEFMVGRGRPRSGPLDGDGRRSLYLNVRRNFLNPLFLAFDYPTPFTAIGKRSVSNVPAQALAMLNNPFVLDQCQRWAERVLAGPARSAEERIQAMIEAAYSRPPTENELRQAQAFLAAQQKRYGRPDHPQAWADLAHVLVNVKEFIYLR